MTKTAFLSLLSRAGWTAAQAALGVVAVAVGTDIPDTVWWAVPVATALSGLKSFIASKVGDPETVTFQ